jgi:hypothetical protein
MRAKLIPLLTLVCSMMAFGAAKAVMPNEVYSLNFFK